MNVTADGNCKRRTRRSAQVPQQGSSPVQSTAWMERRRPALPEESSERARALLCAKRLAKFELQPLGIWLWAAGAIRARASSTDTAREARAHQTYREPAAQANSRAQPAVISLSKAATKSSSAAQRVKRRRRRKDVAPGSKIAGVARRRRATGAATLNSMEPEHDRERCQKNGVARRARDAAAHRCW